MDKVDATVFVRWRVGSEDQGCCGAGESGPGEGGAGVPDADEGNMLMPQDCFEIVTEERSFGGGGGTKVFGCIFRSWSDRQDTWILTLRWQTHLCGKRLEISISSRDVNIWLPFLTRANKEFLRQ
jgi:hypothetical protein